MPTKKKMLSVYPNEKIIARLGVYSSKTCNMALEYFAYLQYEGFRWLRHNLAPLQWNCFAHAFRGFQFGKCHPTVLPGQAFDHFEMVKALLPYGESDQQECLMLLKAMRAAQSPCLSVWSLLHTIRLRWIRWPDEAPSEWWNLIYEGVPF